MRDRSKRTIRIYAIELSAVDHHSYPPLYAVIIESGRKGGREGGIKETGTSKSILWRRAREEENYSRVGFEHIYIYIYFIDREWIILKVSGKVYIVARNPFGK